MANYHERLKAEILRRDLAVARMKCNGTASAGIVITQTNRTMSCLNPTNLIRNYPWIATLGSVALGAAAVPLIKSHFDSRSIANVNAAVVQTCDKSAVSHSQTIVDMVRANLPAIAMALFEHFKEPAKVTVKE